MVDTSNNMHAVRATVTHDVDNDYLHIHVCKGSVYGSRLKVTKWSGWFELFTSLLFTGKCFHEALCAMSAHSDSSVGTPEHIA